MHVISFLFLLIYDSKLFFQSVCKRYRIYTENYANESRPILDFFLWLCKLHMFVTHSRGFTLQAQLRICSGWGKWKHLICLSDQVPSSFKAAYMTPLLNKSDLDSADPKLYRPIANLSELSKLLERLIARQLLDYLNAERLLPELQSAYQTHHSTETALTKVLADIFLAPDAGDLSMLTLLDLLAAFDHETFLCHLEVSYHQLTTRLL